MKHSFSFISNSIISYVSSAKGKQKGRPCICWSPFLDLLPELAKIPKPQWTRSAGQQKAEPDDREIGQGHNSSFDWSHYMRCNICDFEPKFPPGKKLKYMLDMRETKRKTVYLVVLLSLKLLWCVMHDGLLTIDGYDPMPPFRHNDLPYDQINIQHLNNSLVGFIIVYVSNAKKNMKGRRSGPSYLNSS